MKRQILTLVLLFATGKMSFGQIHKAPAYPLITHSTYFSIWSMSDSLNTTATQHWAGAEQALTGLIQVDNATYSFMGKPTPYSDILPAADEVPYTCKYIESTPATGWQNLSFDDSTWPIGAPVFSDDNTGQTLWNTHDIYMRRVFNMDALNTDPLLLKLYHDDNVEVYLNGTLIYSKNGWNNTYDIIPVTNKLVKGQNILAVHCVNTAGGAKLDVGLLDGNPSGPGVAKKAFQNSVTVTATQTLYNFKCGGVDLNLKFTSPLLLNDLALVSRPVSYITYSVKANDGKTHSVKVYLGVSGNIARNFASEVIATTKYSTGQLSILKAGTVNQPVLQGTNNLIDWGYAYVAVPKIFNSTQYISQSGLNNPFLSDTTTSTLTQSVAQRMNTIIPFGTVGATPIVKFAEVGYDDIYTVSYFGQNLPPYWKAVGGTIERELTNAAAGYVSIMQRCNTFDSDLYNDALKAGGANYAMLCALAYRQAITAGELTKTPEGDLLFPAKENSSGGFTNTVDVSFPSSPVFALYNPALLEGLMNGVFHLASTNAWTANYAPHDIGQYPVAATNRYPFGMPIEESGNMILMSAAVCRAEGSISYAKKNWTLLTKWANYLNGVGFNPPNQLTSDDFAGVIAHSVNLSAKLINAVAAYAGMARAMGDMTTFNKYYSSAKSMAAQWVAVGSAGDHSLLAFDQPGTWSQKYNIVWDKLLDLHLFPDSVYDKDTKYYISKIANYGVPLDNRQTYTKSDWSVWTALVANKMEDFETLIDPVYKLATTNHDRVPLTDFYLTTTGAIQSGFKARPVVGGFFIKMLQKKWHPGNACAAPTGLTTNNITNTKATFHWQLSTTPESFRIQGKVADSVNWKEFTLPGNDTVYTLTGLSANTTYQWRVASVCQTSPEILSDYSEIQTFKTQAYPDTIKTGSVTVVLSPNPATNFVTIKVANATGPMSFQITDLYGKVYIERDNFTTTNFTVPLGMKGGVYLVKVKSNGEFKTVKLIKTN